MQTLKCNAQRMAVTFRQRAPCRAARLAKRNLAARASGSSGGPPKPEDLEELAQDVRNPRSQEQGVSRSAEPIVEATADTGAFTTTPVVASDVVIVVETDAAPEPTVDAAAVVDKAVDSAEEVVNEVADSVKEVAEGSVEALEKAVDELPSGEEVIDAAEKAVTDVVDGAEEIAAELSRQVSSADAELQKVSGEVQKAVVENSAEVVKDLEKVGKKVKGRLEDATAELKRRGQNYDDTQRSIFEQTVSITAMAPQPEDTSDSAAVIEYLRLRLLASVAGSDRGFAVNKNQAAEIKEAAEALAAAGGPVTLVYGAEGGGSGERSVGALTGLWRLAYSSGFATGSTGGKRPGLPVNMLPAQLGQIYQGISSITGRLDNIVEFRRPALPNLLSFLPPNEAAVATLTLKHTFSIVAPDKVEISFIGGDVNVEGGAGGILSLVPQIHLPELPENMRSSKGPRGASFRVIYLDDDLRITMGDRNELRLFIRT